VPGGAAARAGTADVDPFVVTGDVSGFGHEDEVGPVEEFLRPLLKAGRLTVNPGFVGRLGSRQFEAVRAALAPPKLAERTVFVPSHHGPLGPSDRFDWIHSGFLDASGRLGVLNERPAVVMHGHSHARSWHGCAAVADSRRHIMSKKKPGDETIGGLPVFARAEDSFVGRTPGTGQQKAVTAAAAPEVSQGRWRERVFTPRGTMSKEEIILALETALRQAVGQANHQRVAFGEVRKAWLPALRQALEQAGGDGIDAWLLTILKPPGRAAMDPLFGELADALGRMRAARDLAGLEEAGIKTIELVRKVLSFLQPRKLSFKQMERELEGRLEVDELLLIRVSSDDELTRRLREIGSTMEQLRDQLKSRPGQQPDGMFSNFVRLKAELRVLDAELKRRAVAPVAP
jgi:hypothetical protein